MYKDNESMNKVPGFSDLLCRGPSAVTKHSYLSIFAAPVRHRQSSLKILGWMCLQFEIVEYKGMSCTDIGGSVGRGDRALCYLDIRHFNSDHRRSVGHQVLSDACSQPYMLAQMRLP